MNGRKWILLAEDDAYDADLTMRALTSGGEPCDVVRVCDGAEALDCLQRRGAFQSRDNHSPAIVLLDLKMPKVDGLEALDRIKNDDALKSIPVVMFTSSREKTDVLRSYQSGANAYVVKPLNFQEYISALNGVKNFWLFMNESPPDDMAKVEFVQRQLAVPA